MREDIHNKLKKFTREELCLLNKSELERRFNCDPRTVERYLKTSSGEFIQKKSSRVYTSLLDDYKSIIIEKIDNYGATAMTVYKFIKKKGYKGKYSTVADFINKHKKVEINKVTIRFETTPGLQAQVDWKENLTMISKHREILFDNMKTVIDRSKINFSHVEFKTTFKHFADDAGFKPIACRPCRPQTKGKVEALARLTNHLTVYNSEFEDYADIERIANNFMDEINNEISQAINEIPLNLLKKDKEYLKPLPSLDLLCSYVYCEKEYKVTKESIINYKGKNTLFQPNTLV